jgi:hypothetical protein
METTEKIVEAYVRYVKEWATIPNIKCPGQYEIDLIAIDPKRGRRYHIECGVSISSGFNKLTNDPFIEKHYKNPTQKAKLRRTLDFFRKRKFGPKQIIDTLKKYGFKRGKYSKVIVTWAATDEAKKAARRFDIELWYFPEILTEIAEAFKEQRAYFTDDTLRTLQLYAIMAQAGKDT